MRYYYARKAMCSTTFWLLTDLYGKDVDTQSKGLEPDSRVARFQGLGSKLTDFVSSSSSRGVLVSPEPGQQTPFHRESKSTKNPQLRGPDKKNTHTSTTHTGSAVLFPISYKD